MNIFEITEETTNARGETYLPPVRVNNKEIDATLVFSKRPSGKYQKMSYFVDATNEGNWWGAEWHDTYNKTYDSEKQWRAAHARYSKKYAAQQREQ
ncbi:MAG: hypothetical protein GKR97_10095 [Rhizobiaceae bacterium]|nr:hypothetical protein [Rhizobiaceae bacterium]